MISRKLLYFKALFCHLIFFINGCGSKIDYTWKSIDITVERGIDTLEGYFISEAIIKKQTRKSFKMDKLTNFIYSTQSPFPLKIISAQWKIIDTHIDSSLQWGYQLVLVNDYSNDSLYVDIRRIIIELLDKDGFSVKEYNRSFDNEPLGRYAVFKKQEPYLIKHSYPLQVNEAKRVKECKMHVECSIKENYRLGSREKVQQ